MNKIDPTFSEFHEVWPLDGLSPGLSKRAAFAMLGLMVLIALLAFASRLAVDPKRFPVVQVDVLGTLDYANRDVLMDIIQRHTEMGFYGLDIDDLRQGLESNDWVASSRVSRVWPARITLDIEEHEPAARWNDDHLISKRLELFKPHQLRRASADFKQWSDVFKPLPQVLGSLGRHEVLLDAYRDYDQQLSLLGLKMALLEEDERLSQTLTLANGVSVKLGREQQVLRMNRFLDVYEYLAAQGSGRQMSFDMRYESGFALGDVSASTIEFQE